MKTEVTEKRCWNPKCKRIIVGGSKLGLGLCDTCFNKFGTIGAGVGGILLFFGGPIYLKNKEKIDNMIKHIGT